MVAAVLPVHAQTDSLQRQQQEQLRQLQSPRPFVDQPSTAAAAQDAAPALLSDLGVSPFFGCRTLTALNWQGTITVTRPVFDGVTARWQGQCVDQNMVAQLLRDAAASLVAAGFISSRIKLAPDTMWQQHSQNAWTLNLEVIEGKVEQIVGLGGLSARELRHALPLRPGDVLRVGDLDQGLDQLGRLASRSVTADIAPGEQTGNSVIVIHNHLSSTPVTGSSSVTVSNRLAASSGPARVDMNWTADNPLDASDSLTVGLGSNLGGHAGSLLSAFGIYSLALGYGTASLTLDTSRQEQNLAINGVDLLSVSQASQIQARYDRVLWRNASQRISAWGALARRQSRQTLDNDLLAVSSGGNTGLEAGLSASGRSQWASRPWFWSLQGWLAAGVPWLGGRGDSGAVRSTGDAVRQEYRKWQIQADLQTAINPDSRSPVWYQASASAMGSAHPLPGAQELGLGDVGGVRGFFRNPVSVYRGAWLRQTFNLSVAAGWTAWVGLDVGQGRSATLGDLTLGSLSTGLRWEKGRSAVDVEISRGQIRSDQPATQPGSTAAVRWQWKTY
ncbi:ShlB/FhaC/HecB family hemolysin secretion/activation protein [Amphibiibacter pelophylacis]|uniref:ShlB/FhaC/HecB family hemolysin secretion/activation protein n=1 Tax=Amphibiibacter pelophylacis TaxID=1799477 RepID=A0ACC6P3Q0_9BURK